MEFHLPFGHKDAPKTPETTPVVDNPEADRAAEAASEAAFDKLEGAQAGPVVINAPTAVEAAAPAPVTEAAPEAAPTGDNVVELPSPEAPNPEDPQGPVGTDHQLTA